MVQSDAESQAFQDCTARPKPFLAKRNRRVQDIRIALRERGERATLMQLDDDVGKGLNASTFRAENENRLALVYEPPSGRQAEFTLVVWKEACPASLRRHEVRGRKPYQEPLNPWT